jgi:hopene-associated glycosyltransferase HpnB
VAVLSILSFMVWLVLVFGRRGFWRAERRSGAFRPPALWPSVAAIVPARNEAETIQSCLASILAQDYDGPLRAVLIDDQSNDGTADRARALGDSRLSILSGQPLPPGWTGKMWAVAQGVAHAGADRPAYFWFTDADIAHQPSVLARLVAQAEAESRVLVSRLARLHCQSGWEKLLIPAFIFFFQKLYPFDAVNDSKSRVAAAAGGCMLVKADALTQAGGIETIRDSVIDDCALARRMKAVGPIHLALGEQTHSLRAYPQLTDLWLMVARTAFVQLRHSLLLLVGTLLGMGIVYLVPPLAVLLGILGGDPTALTFGGAAWILMSVAYRPSVALYRLAFPWVLTLPLAGLLYALMTLDSARRHWLGKGAPWKGRTHAAQGGATP